MHLSARSLRAPRALALAAVAAALAPAAAQAAPPARVVLEAPRAGDISYAMAQVKVGRTSSARKVRGTKVFAGRAAGVRVQAVSPTWKKLRATTKAYAVVSRVAGGPSNLRNVTFFLVRRAGANTRPSGKVTFTLPGASANTKSFWVRGVRGGVADVFHGTNALTTAVANWSRYVTTLRSLRALRAAARAIDSRGTFRAPKRARAASARSAAAAPAVSSVGAKPSALTKQVFMLLFGTLNDPDAAQAAKKSPLVTKFIRNELRNPALAKKFADVVAVLPSAVPDAFAANAKEERRFGATAKPRISSRQVVLRDLENARTQAAIEVPRETTDAVPGQRVTIQLRGNGSGVVKPNRREPEQCASDCSVFWPSGYDPSVTAVASPGSEFTGWQGCTDGTSNYGRQCNLVMSQDPYPKGAVVIATFTRTGSSGGGGGGGTGGASEQPAPSTPSGTPGVLDTTFGTSGMTLLPVGPGTGFGATGLARQSDGRFLVVGTGDSPAATKIARYRANGTLDTAFGAGGVVTLPAFSGDEFHGWAVSVDAADRIVVAGDVDDAGSTDTLAGLVRLSSDGIVEAGFGGATDGLVRFTAGDSGNARARGVIVDRGSGTIYVAGRAWNAGRDATFVTARTATGATDGTYHGGSPLVDQPSGTDIKVNAMTLDASGRVVLAGDATQSATQGPFVRRYTTAGAVDASFNGGDPLFAPVPGADFAGAEAITVQSDGRLIVGGYSYAGSTSCMLLARVTAAGGLDGDFGSAGRVTYCPGQYGSASGVAVNGDGIYAAGHVYGSSATQVLLARFTSAGALDASFNGGAFQQRITGGDATASAVVLDGFDPVIAGSYLTSLSSPDDAQFLLERIKGR